MGVCTSMCKAGSGQKSSLILAPGILALVGGMGVPNANTFSSLQHQDWKYLKWTFLKTQLEESVQSHAGSSSFYTHHVTSLV